MNLSRADTQLLTAAAGRLASVESAHPDGADAGVRLHCLRALDLLDSVGAYIGESEPADRYEISDLLRRALRDLAALMPEVFALDEVVEAAAATRYALQLCAPGQDGAGR